MHHALDLHRVVRDDGGIVAAHAARLVLIVVVAVVVRLLLGRAVTRVVRATTEGSVPAVLRPLHQRALTAAPTLTARRQQRAEAIGSVLSSIVTFAVAGIAGAMALAELGLDLAPVVASAGILGVAVGFGAQNLVKDFLTGMFMLLEDQYGVGDVIDAGPASGTVEAVGLRSTRLRDVQGVVWHIRNGEIDRVGNKSQGWARALLDIPLALNTDVAVARSLSLDVATTLWEEEAWRDVVLEAPEVWGLESIGSDGLVLRVVVKTAPLEQWRVARELRQRLIAAFGAHGIDLAAPSLIGPA